MLQEDLIQKYGSLGAYLQNIRKDKHLSLDDVVSSINIRKHYLEALEDNRYQDLPERTYALGYLRSYASFLGVDNVDNLVAILDNMYYFLDPVYFDKDNDRRPDYTNSYSNDGKSVPLSFVEESVEPTVNSKENLQKKITKFPKIYRYLLVLLIILVICYIVFMLYSKNIIGNMSLSSKSVVENAPQAVSAGDMAVVEVPKSTSYDVKENENIAQDDESTTEQKVEPASNIVQKRPFPKENVDKYLEINFDNTVKIRIYKKDQPNIVYVDKWFKGGETFQVPGVSDLVMDISNYKGAYLIVGTDILYLNSETKGNYLRGIDLNKQALLDKFKN